MKQILLSILFVSLISLNSFAHFVNLTMAKKVAYNFYTHQYITYKGKAVKDLEISTVLSVKYHQRIVYYIINFKDNGFVEVAADDASYPILAYDYHTNILKEGAAANYESWQEMYKKQLEYIQNHHLNASTRISYLWNQLINNESTNKGGKSVEPLLLCNWNQGAPYNRMCPEDATGPGGRVYAGCVAVAMAQIMDYYRYPKQGSGSHSYTHNVYGTLSANFGNTTYNWNAMTNSIGNDGNHEIAQLLYQLGVSVNMNYSASGSGAWSGTAASALVNYFKYQSSVSLLNKDDYTYSQWVTMIIASIDSAIPLYYHGFDPNGGHAFNLDGYQGSDHFHFNWGWGGSYNGYYYLSALNPSTNNFINGQGAIFNIYPASNYPYSCSTGNILETISGTLADGSGPSLYENNLNCDWSIKPTAHIDYIKIHFDRFDLMAGDTLYIYDRNGTHDSLIAGLSGYNIPADILSDHKELYLHFVSNATQKGQGFALSYQSYFPIYCSGISYYTDSANVISDGSDTNKYNNSTSCRWLIEPTNGLPIRLVFDAFNTELHQDYVKIYDPVPTPSVLLASYSGNAIPPSVYSPSGQMIILFRTNRSNAYNGWSAHYYTGSSVGIQEIANNQQITLYPNPATKTAYIQLVDPSISIKQIRCFSIEGKRLRNITFNTQSSKDISMDINQLKAGLYFIQIISNKATINKKLLVR